LKKQEPLKNEMVDFLDANCGLREETACFRGLRTDGIDGDPGIDKKRKPLVTGEDGIEAVRIAEAALESIKERKVVGLDGS
jgi:predicted dehydrogenase